MRIEEQENSLCLKIRRNVKLYIRLNFLTMRVISYWQRWGLLLNFLIHYRYFSYMGYPNPLPLLPPPLLSLLFQNRKSATATHYIKRLQKKTSFHRFFKNIFQNDTKKNIHSISSSSLFLMI